MKTKDKILNEVKDSKKSTSRIAGILGLDYNYTLKILEELLSEGKIIKLEETNATYWSVK